MAVDYAWSSVATNLIRNPMNPMIDMPIRMIFIVNCRSFDVGRVTRVSTLFDDSRKDLRPTIVSPYRPSPQLPVPIF
jgi:hypothetical protein